MFVVICRPLATVGTFGLAEDLWKIGSFVFKSDVFFKK